MTEQFLLKKRGYFYRADAQGYTANVTEAGRYDQHDAEERSSFGDGVTMHAVSEFPELATNTVADIPDEKLLQRAVRNARSNQYRKGQKHARWVAVMDTFALGSTYAHQLCRRFGLAPDEQVKR